MSGFDYNQLHRIVQRMSRADMINVFSVGTSATVALEFQQKMLRFGKIVNLTMSSCFLPGYALTATEHTVNLQFPVRRKPDVVESLKLLKRINATA